MDATRNLIKMARWAGQRFDLVQAGGGNASVKLDSKRMLIKASGVSLSELAAGHGYVEVALSTLQKAIKKGTSVAVDQASESRQERMQAAADLVAQATKDEGRASIETVLHVLLDTYVLHTHGIVVNVLASRKDWQEAFASLFPESLCVAYHTPGIDLAHALQRGLTEYETAHDKKPAVIFLQNHGLIVSAPTAEEVIFITEEVTTKLEQALNITENVYRLTETVATLVNQACGSDKIAYLSNDDGLKRLAATAQPLFFQKPLCPDTAVYCGQRLVVLDSLQDTGLFQRYHEQFNETPHVVMFQDKIFFVADSVKKARDIEEALKFHLSVLVLNLRHNVDPSQLNYLEDEEIGFLSGWEAEKYRQNVA